MVEITLSSGQVFQIWYVWTFGDMAITASILALTVVISIRFVYDITMYVWALRRRP